MIKACIFDLDGVLVDTAKYHFLAWRRMAKEIGYDLTEAVNEKLKGVSRMHSLEIILELAGVSLNDTEKQKIADKKNSWFMEYIENMKAEEIFPGVKPALQQLRKAGIKVALASSSKNAETVIDILGIKNDFNAIVDGTMIVHTKPDPEIFLLAAQKLKVQPNECLVFEDAESGVEAALRAGMKCVGIGKRDQLQRAHSVVNAVQEFDFKQLQSL